MNASKAQQKGQQRLLLVTGGVLVVIAASLLWYNKYSRTRRRQHRDDLIFNEAVDDDDDFNNEPDEELRRVFIEAAKVAKSFGGGVLDQRDQLMLYGLYKQATEGDRNDDDHKAPSKIDVVAHAKYNSWGEFNGLPKRFAMQKYCEVVYHFANGGESAYNNNSSSNGDNADVVYDDDDDSQVDIDDEGYPSNTTGGDEYADEGVSGSMGHRPSTLSGEGIEDKLPQDEQKSTAIAPDIRLRNAAIANDINELQTAILDGCDIDAADDDGQTALHFAADRKSRECLSKLIEAGANVNAIDCDGFGVLQIALSSGLDVESVRLLLMAGANPDICDDDGESPRSWVAEEGNVEMKDLFASFPAVTE